MVCALRPDQSTTDISVADLKEVYEGHSKQLLVGTRRATAFDWIEVTAKIAIAIATKKLQPKLALGGPLHEAFKDLNARSTEALCPCPRCNRQIWEPLG